MDYKEKVIALLNSKELSQEQKEKLEEIFPELADERIKNEIIAFVEQSIHRGGGTPIPEEQETKWIAWLEKQGKKKPEPKFKVGDVIRLKGSAAEYTIERVTDTRYYTNGWFCGIDRCEEDYELAEQKPTAWSEEDENHIKSILSTIECCKAQFPNAQAVVEAYNADIKWLKSLRPQSQWRPSDLPHWKKSTLPNDNTTGFNSDYFCYKGYNINYKELFEKLPKDD